MTSSEPPKSSGNGGGLTALQTVSPSQFVDRGDLTALTVFDQTFSGASAQQALFSGTLFRSSKFIKCDFRRADFEGAVFEHCSFENCDFSIADFRSVEAVETSFSECRFDEGSIRTTSFTNCKFHRCSLQGHSFNDNKIEKTAFHECSFERSTLLHCAFKQTLFEFTDLADCTSQFHVFEDCELRSSRLNAESIGLTFGLTFENIRSAGLVWRGLAVDPPAADANVAEVLSSTYVARGWPFAAAILRLNFKLVPKIEALDEAFSALAEAFKSDRPIKVDEVRFLREVLQWLSNKGRLPFLAIVHGLEVVVGLAEVYPNREAEFLRSLYHSLKDAEQREINAIEQTFSSIQGIEGKISVAFVFVEKPQISFHAWLDELSADGLLTGDRPQFRSAAQGSYIEVFYMTAATLSSILVCLCLIERITDRLVSIRARTELLTSRKLPAVVRRRALQPVVALSPSLQKELRSYIERATGRGGTQFISDTEEFAGKLTRIEIE